MGACVSLAIFQPVFQFRLSLMEGQTPLETQSSRKLRENRHPNRGNWQRNCRKGSRISSALMRPEYRHKYTGNWVSLGLHLMEILDSKIKHVRAWVAGDLHHSFPPMGARTARSGSRFPFPEVPYTIERWKMWKCLLLQKESQHVPVGVIWRNLKVKLRCASLLPPTRMWPDLHCCPT